MAARKWTIEQRKRQAELIKQWQPWLNSTGARTIEGKMKSSRNAFKGGFKEHLSKLSKLMREQRDWLEDLSVTD